jgi:hypothetical protein
MRLWTFSNRVTTALAPTFCRRRHVRAAALTDIVAAYAPTNVLMGQQFDHCINFAPQHHYVL